MCAKSSDLNKLKSELSQSELVLKCAKQHNTVGDPSAMKVCYLLRRYPDLSVGEVAELVGLSVSATSRCLAKLREADVVRATKEAQKVRYRLQENMFTRQLITQLEG